MKLRLGQHVRTSDGVFGEIGDIVVDPVKRTVTHLVVEPHHHHYLARLVPIDLVGEATDDAITLNVGIKHLRSLASVADNEYVPIGDIIDVGPEWDLGVEDITSIASSGIEYGMLMFSDHVLIDYDRVPRGECEIRSSSSVSIADGQFVGTVEGFLVDDTNIAGVVVRARRGLHRHYVIVPMHAVAKVRTDAISLILDKAAFDALPDADDILGPDDASSTITRIEHGLEDAMHSLEVKLSRRLRRH